MTIELTTTDIEGRGTTSCATELMSEFICGVYSIIWLISHIIN